MCSSPDSCRGFTAVSLDAARCKELKLLGSQLQKLSASSPASYLQKRHDSVLEGTGGVRGRKSLRNAIQENPRQLSRYKMKLAPYTTSISVFKLSSVLCI